MTPEETKAVAHRWHLDVVQEGNLGVADEILAPNSVAHVNGQDVRGPAEAKQLATALRTALPDLRITHHEDMVSGDRVAIRWTSDGSHQGDYFGVPPTGERIHIEGLDLFHIQDGKIAEMWVEFDNLGVLQQMGAAPQPQQAGA
jgi:predicted ester cyclase